MTRYGPLIEGLHFSRPLGMHPRYNEELLEQFVAGTDVPARRAFAAQNRGRQGCKVNLEVV
jgi:hypothetical protein